MVSIAYIAWLHANTIKIIINCFRTHEAISSSVVVLLNKVWSINLLDSSLFIDDI